MVLFPSLGCCVFHAGVFLLPLRKRPLPEYALSLYCFAVSPYSTDACYECTMQALVIVPLSVGPGTFRAPQGVQTVPSPVSQCSSPEVSSHPLDLRNCCSCSSLPSACLARVLGRRRLGRAALFVYLFCCFTKRRTKKNKPISTHHRSA